MESRRRIIVIGGGAAGLMAALFSAQSGLPVTLLEKNEKLGKKIYITGKGRGNLTNTAEREMFLSRVFRNPRFMYAPLAALDNTATMDLFGSLGLSLKVERGGRVFPESDHASDITAALTRALRDRRVEIRLNDAVKDIIEDPNGDCAGVETLAGDRIEGGAVIIATGGLSYPSTGSTGDGYGFAARLGHSIRETSPGLVPLETVETWPGELAGLSLKNVRLTAFQSHRKKALYSEMGEMLFTHSGISGPLVLTLSSLLPKDLSCISLEIDLKPALDEQKLENRLLRDLAQAPNRQLSAVMDGLVPHRLGQRVLALARIPGSIRANSLQAPARKQLVNVLKHVPLAISGTGGYEEAIITRGGVDVKEIDPATMSSRKHKGFYFAGEVLDLDAATGGYNMQIAFSTGALAGRSAAEFVLGKGKAPIQ